MRTIVLILAGGESTRMGEDKAAMLRPDGRTQLEFTRDLAETLSPDEIIVSTNTQRQLERTTEISDRHPGSGPLAGIESSLPHLKMGDRLLVLPCDMPILTSALLEPLLNLCPAAYEHRWLPCSVIVTDELKEYILNALTGTGNQRSVRALLTHCGAHLLPADNLHQLSSANSPEEWLALIGTK